MIGRNKQANAGGTFNDYSDTDYTATDEEAHRSTEYRLPSSVNQMLTVTKATLKLFSKSYTFITLTALVLLIPLLVYAGLLDFVLGDDMSVYDPGDYAATLLGALPVFIALIPAAVMSKLIPSEFRDRTAYLSLALPQSRASFFFGKFLAGMLVQIFVFTLAYGVIALVTGLEIGSLDGSAVLLAFAITIIGGFAISATVYALSTFMKKGSALLLFLLFYMVIPAVMILIDANTVFSDIIGGFIDNAQYLPPIAGDVATFTLGTPYELMSPVYFYSMLVENSGITLFNYNSVLDMGVYAVWGAAFLLLGLYRFERREM